MPAASSTTIDLVRHGEVTTPGLFCAPANEPLSKAGWAQLEALQDHGRWDQIVSSPHKRCHEFAEQLAAHQPCPLYRDKRLREMDFGAWCGKTQQDIWRHDKTRMQQLWQSPLTFTAPNGESMQTFIERVECGWQHLLEQYQGQSILLLSHAGVIRVILTIALAIPQQSALKFNIVHAKINRIRHYSDNQYSLEGWGLDAPTYTPE